MHDLLPSIEPDREEFNGKTALALTAAVRPVTLTPWARDQMCRRFGLPFDHVHVVPHGYVMHPGEVPSASSGTMSGEPPVLGAYGALRPNLSFAAVVDLWRRLAVAGRPGLLRLLVRSISPADVGRYPTTVAEIASLLRTGASVDVRLMSDAATDSEIVDFC